MVRLLSESEFAAMREEWNKLLSESDNNSVFLLHEWVLTWWRIFKTNKTLFTIAIYNDANELIGIAPLYLEKISYLKLLRLRIIQFLGANKISPDYLGFIFKSGDRKMVFEGILKFLFENSSQWDIIRLGDMLCKADEIALIKALCQNNHRYFSIIDQVICPYIDLPNSIEAYLQSFGHNHRYNLKRIVKTLNSEFDCEYGTAKSDEEMTDLLAALFDLHQQRANVMNRSSAFDSDLIREFHKQLIPELFNKGIFNIYYLKLDGKVQCCMHAFIYNKCFYFYQSGFNPEYSRFSLGRIMLFNTIRSAIEQGCERYDFLKGDEAYKRHWAKKSQQTVTLLIGNIKIKALIYALLIVIRMNIGSMLKNRKGKTDQMAS